MSKKLTLASFALILILIFLTACSSGGTAGTTDTTGASLSAVGGAGKSPDADYVVYEAVFVNNEQIVFLFNEVRGEAPYPKVPSDYHVTTSFLPEEDERELYGKEVTVHITGYKAGDVTSDDGGTTRNEGFKVELASDDPDVTAYLESHVANFHITGSFTDQAKYTGYLDFSDAEPLEYSVTGTLGAYMNSGKLVFSAGDVDQKK